MQAAPEVMAQQGAQLAATRAAEMESARNALAQAQMNVANQEAAQGAAKRQYMQSLIGAAIGGAASATTMGLKPDEKAKDGQEQAAAAKPKTGGYDSLSPEQQKADIMGYGSASQAQTAEPRDAIRRTGMGATRGVMFAEGPSNAYGVPGMGALGIGASESPFQLQFGAQPASPVRLAPDVALGQPMIGLSPRVRRAGGF